MCIEKDDLKVNPAPMTRKDSVFRPINQLLVIMYLKLQLTVSKNKIQVYKQKYIRPCQIEDVTRQTFYFPLCQLNLFAHRRTWFLQNCFQ